LDMRIILSLLLSGFFLFYNGFSTENQVFKEDFEKFDVPQKNWISNPSKTAKAKILLDVSSTHSGKRSVLIENPEFGYSSLSLDEINLKVGHIYRLRGWIKTERVSSDVESRYPTSLPACIGMTSFPFTNHSPTVGGNSEWIEIETLFIATKAKDRVVLHLGLNGKAKGKAWFDDIEVEEVEDISKFIPYNRVIWFGDAFRYDENGWIFIHIEGEPYKRGYQHGYLLSKEIVSYIEKLAVRANKETPSSGWDQMRLLADSLMLRKFDEEYLLEMKGISDGASKAGAKIFSRAIDLLDIVTVNSAVDLGQLVSALYRTPSSISKINFFNAEDELQIPEFQHKCSSLLATKPASVDGRIVFGQLFMWNGYTGIHWNVICDLVPSRGFRFVYETFPGGIHSGADFYINSAGIMIGETTVMQTPFNIDGTPQSNRIRKAIQYSKSIDDVVSILTEKNNGLYTNDWLIGDTKTDEIAILLLGTKNYKLWRSSKGDFPGGTKGFLWSDNNAKALEVRKEYVTNQVNSPFDLIYSPSNRDIEFFNFYRKFSGKIDSVLLTNLWASSPITRPHACDGKVTTSEMAEKLVFLAHFGKTTLREKFPEKGSRLIPDLPGAVPHLALGYTVFSPIYISEKLKELKAKLNEKREIKKELSYDYSEVREIFEINKRELWQNTVFPSSDSENWFVSGSSAYWNIINEISGSSDKFLIHWREQLQEINHRLLYIISREGDIPAVDGRRIYSGYKNYLIPRIKGTFLLHQLRLFVGNKIFFSAMREIHEKFLEKEISNTDIIKIFEDKSGVRVEKFVRQWIEREGLPQIALNASLQKQKEKIRVTLKVIQREPYYHFFTTLSFKFTDGKCKLSKIEVKDIKENQYIFEFPSSPEALIFNYCNDIPVNMKEFYTFSNLADDFKNSIIVYGTSKHTDTNRTLAMRFQNVIADVFTDTLIPLKKDSELSKEEILNHDLIIIGSSEDNSLLKRVEDKLPIKFGKGFFRWRGSIYSSPDDGIFLALSNPFNTRKILYLFIGNSPLQIYQMTKSYPSLPSWALFKGERIIEKGFHFDDSLILPISE
ncbi:MAG: hypothetical protein ACUVUG_06460, partial [Candidatus Aminicenantia bacterium]